MMPSGGNGAEGFIAMRRRATGLLIAMAALFIVSRLYIGLHPAMGFVKAFAEAAMVGGLADWFAVTALFRHPLGLPIPHTAIIPRNKDRIGDTLAQFLRTNFLTPAVVARRMQAIDVASAIGRYLDNPQQEGAGRIHSGATRLLSDILAALDDEQLGSMVKTAIADKLRALDAAPLLGQALTAAMKDDRHRPILDGLVIRAAGILNQNEPLIRQMIHDRSNRFLRWTGLDEDVADAIINGLNKLLDEMATDPSHPARAKMDEMLADLAKRLQSDKALQARVNTTKAQIVDNPAMQKWIGGLWDQGRAALLGAARDPKGALGGKLGEALRQLGTNLQADPRLQATINRFFRRAAAGTAARHGDKIVTLISETIRKWDTQKVTDRIELAVGRDLQFIRINGTLVGGLVGLILHAIDVAL